MNLSAFHLILLDKQIIFQIGIYISHVKFDYKYCITLILLVPRQTLNEFWQNEVKEQTSSSNEPSQKLFQTNNQGEFVNLVKVASHFPLCKICVLGGYYKNSKSILI